jgi:hypothetical protein
VYDGQLSKKVKQKLAQPHLIGTPAEP